MATVTDAKIHAAADALAKRGENPTQAAVRRELGGGSFATIGPALQQWREKQEEEQELSDVAVPAHIIERGKQLQAAIWQTAMQEAEQRLAVRHEELEEQARAADSAIQESREAVELLEGEANDHVQRISELEKQLADKEKALTKAVNAQSDTERKLASTEAAAEAKRNGLEERLKDAQQTIEQLVGKIGKSKK